MEEERENTETSTENTESKKELSEKPSEALDKDNIIFVGIKPFMNYVTGVVMQFQNKGQDEVIVSAIEIVLVKG